MTRMLYHYTCGHGADGIRRDGEIRPNQHPMVSKVPVVWLTTLELPDRQALGLTSQTLTCDRTEWRVTVQSGDVEPWHVFARRHRVRREVRDVMEDGRMPMLWWVAVDPLPVDARAVCLVGAL